MKGLNQLDYIFSLKGKRWHFVKDKHWHFVKHSEFLHFGLVNVYKNGEQTEYYFRGSCTHPVYLAYTFFSVILVLVQTPKRWRYCFKMQHSGHTKQEYA